MFCEPGSAARLLRGQSAGSQHADQGAGGKVSLVERRKSGIELTEQGEEIARRARGILASVRDLVDYAKHQEGVLSGILKLGAIPSIAPYLLPAALPELHRRFPGLNLQLRETVTSNLVHELVTGDLDLVLIALPIEDPEVETLYLFDDRFILATKATKQNHSAPPCECRYAR